MLMELENSITTLNAEYGPVREEEMGNAITKNEEGKP